MSLTPDFLDTLTHALARANEDDTVVLVTADKNGSMTHTQSVRPAELVAIARTILETAEDMLDASTKTRADMQALSDARAALEYLPDRGLEDDEDDGDGEGDAA